MKKYLVLTIVCCCFLFTAFSQKPNRAEMRDRLDAQRVAYITDKIDLTAEEAQQFWPVYNQFKKEKTALHKTARPPADIAGMSDAEISASLNARLDMEEKILSLKRKYLEDLKQIISVRKIAGLLRAERSFKEEILRKMRHSRGKGKDRRAKQGNR